jgi:hypothetical protein
MSQYPPPPALPPDERARAIARWEKTRAMGRTDFIIRRGVLGWGVPAAIFTIVYKAIQEQGFATPHLTDALRTVIAVAFVVFPLAGGLFGRWLWSSGEERYRALTNDGESRR